MYYRRLTNGLEDKGVLLPEDQDIYTFIDQDSDYYLSTYKYNETQKKLFDQLGTITGIVDVITNSIWWDFDSEFEPDQARLSAIELIKRLKAKGIDSKDIQISFSGNKGFGVEVFTQEELKPKEVKTLAFELVDGLDHFDTKMYNASRINRVLLTKHQKTGLYKTPLTFEQLSILSTDDIMTIAKQKPLDNEDFRWQPIQITKYFPNAKREISEKAKKEIKPGFATEIDFSKKVKGWPNCKWALSQGYDIREGDRHEKLMCIAAHAKYLNYTKELAYYTIKNADEQGVNRNGGTRRLKEDLWKAVEEVYSDKWRGGTYSCKDANSPWLTEICNSLGPYKCQHTEHTSYVEVTKVFNEFEQFAKDIDKHTIKTGIESLDRSLRLRTGQMIGILGAPSSGKTALALELLENTSRQGLLSVFYSLDMSSSELFQKIAQRVTGYTDSDLYRILQTDKGRAEQIRVQVCEAYENVKFCFDTGVSVDAIQESISTFEADTNKKVKLLLLDYNELLSSPYSDATAASGYNAGALKKLTNLNSLCTITLLQPPKVVGDAGDEIISYRSIKGSSLTEQALSIVIGIYRPGFNPKNNSEDDQFLVMNILKNRLGKLFRLEYYWDGTRGKIDEITDHEGKRRLEEVIARKQQEKEQKDFI